MDLDDSLLANSPICRFTAMTSAGFGGFGGSWFGSESEVEKGTSSEAVEICLTAICRRLDLAKKNPSLDQLPQERFKFG